jgi:phage terminase large subunit-like protein
MVNLIGATADDARDIMIEGESGILSVCPNNERPQYKKADRKLEWPNGATSLIFTADEPDRLRGKQHKKLWADEIASWRFKESWDQAMFGLRLGNSPQAIATTTPRPVSMVKELIADKRNIITRGTTYENRANLAPGFFDYVIQKYEGTRLGRQELLAEVLEDNPDALWSRALIDKLRVSKIPGLVRVVVGVDPEATSTENSAETGIIVAGLGEDKHGYILDDRTITGKPQVWASESVSAYNTHKADRIIGEVNNGGEMIEAVIRTVDPSVSYKAVRATRGKYTRAEPISALYEQGRVHHVGMFADLEDQMCNWVQGNKSPDRMDALVWALTELMDLGATSDDVQSLGRVDDYRNPWS